MRKLLSFLILSAAILIVPAQANTITKDSIWRDATIKSNINTLTSKVSQLVQVDGLIFFKDWSSTATVNAEYSNGSSTGTFTATRSSTQPATYTDASGVMQTTTTSHAPRFTGGLWTSSGFTANPGLIIEAKDQANVLTYSADYSQGAWTLTNTTLGNDSVLTPAGNTLTTNTITASATNGTMTQAYTDAVAGFYTASVWLKRKTGTGTVNLRANTGDSYTAVSVGANWARFEVISSSLTNPTFDLQITTNGNAVYVWGAQMEKRKTAGWYVPTTNAALTRKAETLTYPTAGNRFATETIIFKFAYTGAPVSGYYPVVTGGATNPADEIYYNGDDRKLYCRARSGVDSSVNVQIASNQFYTMVCEFTQTGDPNTTAYLDNVSQTNASNTDFVSYITSNNAAFNVGMDSSGPFAVSVIFKLMAVFNRMLTSAEVTSVIAILNQ